MGDKDSSGEEEVAPRSNKTSGVRTVLVSGKNNGYWRKFNVVCSICERRFETQFQLKQHISALKHFKEGQSWKCSFCESCFLSTRSRLQHERSAHKDQQANPNPAGDNNANGNNVNNNANNNNNNNNNIQPIKTKGMKQRSGDISQSLPSIITEQYNVMLENITKEIMKKVDVREKIENDKLKQQQSDFEASNKQVEVELKKKFAQLHDEQAKASAERKERESAVLLKEKRLEEEVKKMKELNDHAAEKIKLNVGGKYFVTTKSTLTKFSDSMLGTMFSGRHKIVVEKEDDAVFIDRSPKYFNQILGYLRDGEIFVPENMQDKHGLMKEADFYGLKGLADLVAASMGGDDKVDKDKKTGKRKEKDVCVSTWWLLWLVGLCIFFGLIIILLG